MLTGQQTIILWWYAVCANAVCTNEWRVTEVSRLSLTSLPCAYVAQMENNEHDTGDDTRLVGAAPYWKI